MTQPRCCGGSMYVETLWELEGVRRTRQLAEVAVCGKHHRPVGDLRKANTGRWISDEEWALMLAFRKGEPPYYFVRRPDGKLRPEGWKAP